MKIKETIFTVHYLHKSIKNLTKPYFVHVVEVRLNNFANFHFAVGNRLKRLAL